MPLHPPGESEMFGNHSHQQREAVGVSLTDKSTNHLESSLPRLPQPASPPQPTSSPRPASSLTSASPPLLSPQQSINLTAPSPFSSAPGPSSSSPPPTASPSSSPSPSPCLTPPASVSQQGQLVTASQLKTSYVHLTQLANETRPLLLRSASSPSLLSSVTSSPRPPSASSAPSLLSLSPETYTFKSHKASLHSIPPIFVNVFFQGNNSAEPACELSSCQLSPPRSPTDCFFPDLLYPLSHNITDISDPAFVSGSYQKPVCNNITVECHTICYI